MRGRHFLDFKRIVSIKNLKRGIDLTRVVDNRIPDGNNKTTSKTNKNTANDVSSFNFHHSTSPKFPVAKREDHASKVKPTDGSFREVKKTGNTGTIGRTRLINTIGHEDAHSLVFEDIKENVMKLDGSRLEIWLNRMVVEELTLKLSKYIDEDEIDSEKINRVFEILHNRLNGIDPNVYKNTLLLLKLLDKILRKNLNLPFNLPLYTKCIQVINTIDFKKYSAICIDLLLALSILWHRLLERGEINKIAASHSINEDEITTLEPLYKPLLQFIELAAFNCSPISLPKLLDTLRFLDPHLPTNTLVDVHDIAFAKLIQFHKIIHQSQLFYILKSLLMIRSELERPFPPVCRSILKYNLYKADENAPLIVAVALTQCRSVDLDLGNHLIDLHREDSSKLFLQSLIIILLKMSNIIVATRDGREMLENWYNSINFADISTNFKLEERSKYKIKVNDKVISVIKDAKNRGNDDILTNLTNHEWIKNNCIIPNVKFSHYNILKSLLF